MMDYSYHINYLGFADPDKDRSILKDVQGRFRTNIFFEFNKTEGYVPLYTMREQEYKDLPSAYLIYMTSGSEYEAAMKLVGSWSHWQRLQKVKAFMHGVPESMQWRGIESWREEKELKDRAEAYNQLKVAAGSGNVQAQKIVFEGIKSRRKAGRPSKDEVHAEAARQAKHVRDIKDDLERIKLVSNGSTK